MKKSLLRENVRKMKINPHQAKNIQSQSPPHKKLIKKMEMTIREPSQKFDFSLQDNLLNFEPKEEAVDFRVEIERRYQRSIPNKIYVFPRNKDNNGRNGMESNESSNNSSLDSLRHVTIYELNSQNKKKKAVYADSSHNVHTLVAMNEAVADKFSSKARGHADYNWDEDERGGEPIEQKIRDKSSNTYKKLISFLDRHLGQNTGSHNNAPLPIQQTITHQTKYTNAATTLEDNFTGSTLDTHISYPHFKTQENEPKIHERPDKPSYYKGDFRQGKFLATSQAFNKTLSIDRVGQRMDGSTMSTLEKSTIGPGSIKGRTTLDISRLGQDSIKKIYNNNNLMKSVTPHYANTKSFLKENLFGTPGGHDGYSQDRTSQSHLYQKAQNELLNNNKFRISTKSIKNISNGSLSNSQIGIKRDDSSDNRKNFQNFYGSSENPDKTTLSTIATSNTISKKNSFKTINIVSPAKRSGEKQIFLSYDFNHAQVVKKPAFKLDLSKRNQGNGRDTLSSNRSRGGQRTDKTLDSIVAEPYNRTSYEIHQYGSVLNSSSQRNSSKKVISFTPSANMMKNISFSKNGIK